MFSRSSLTAWVPEGCLPAASPVSLSPSSLPGWLPSHTSQKPRLTAVGPERDRKEHSWESHGHGSATRRNPPQPYCSFGGKIWNFQVQNQKTEQSDSICVLPLQPPTLSHPFSLPLPCLLSLQFGPFSLLALVALLANQELLPPNSAGVDLQVAPPPRSSLAALACLTFHHLGLSWAHFGADFHSGSMEQSLAKSGRPASGTEVKGTLGL